MAMDGQPSDYRRGGLSDAQAYLFDTAGYLVIPSVLSPEQLARANQAIDHQLGRLRSDPAAAAAAAISTDRGPVVWRSSPESDTRRFLGDDNLIHRLLRAAGPEATVTFDAVLHALQEGGLERLFLPSGGQQGLELEPGQESVPATTLRSALASTGQDSATIERMVAAVASPDGSTVPLATSARLDVYGLLRWEPPWGDTFRDLLVDPTMSPVLDTLLGPGEPHDILLHSPCLAALPSQAGGWTARRPRPSS